MKKFLLVFIAFLLTATSVLAVEPARQAVELYNKGIDLYQAGEVQKSIDSFNNAIKMAPDFYEAYYNLGQIQTSLKKWDDAIKTYNAINNLRPKDEENLYSLAQAYYKRGYLAKALTYYAQIPTSSKFYADTEKDVAYIKKRQEEMRLEQEAKTAAALADAKKAAETAATAATNATTTAVNAITTTTTATTATTPVKTVEPAKTTTPTAATTTTTTDTALKSTVYEGIPSPSGVAMDANGNIYIASYGDNTIYKINSKNQKSTFVNSSILGGPIGLAVDSSNNLYVANYSKGNILKVAPNGAPTVFLTIKNPYCLNIANDILFVSEQASNTVVKYPL